MNLRTWGRRSSDGRHAMSVLRLCTAIAEFCGLSDNAVLKALRQYPQFDIDLPLDRIVLVDEVGLVEELRRFVWTSARSSSAR